MQEIDVWRGTAMRFCFCELDCLRLVCLEAQRNSRKLEHAMLVVLSFCWSKAMNDICRPLGHKSLWIPSDA